MYIYLLLSADTYHQVHWSAITIGTSPLPLLHPLSPEFKSSISSEVASAAGNIIAAKGCTNFGIGNIAASICKYILSDQRTVRPVSYYQEDLGVTLSMPAVIGRKGIVRPVKVELDEEERGKLEESAKGMREVVKKAEGELEKIQEEAEEKRKGKEGKQVYVRLEFDVARGIGETGGVVL